MAWPWHKSRSTSIRKPMRHGSLRTALAIADLGRPGQLHHHLGMVVAVAVCGLSHLKLELAQQYREDRLDLHGRECGADATVPARTERNPGPSVGDIGLLGFVVAVRV